MNKPTPKTYRTTNWSSYNRALINRGNISIWFDPNTQWYAQPQNKQGRNQNLLRYGYSMLFNDQIFI
ncbi:transposase [Acinetobacter baumannii]|nr:transposase [Acinetobacter baumannii]